MIYYTNVFVYLQFGILHHNSGLRVQGLKCRL